MSILGKRDPIVLVENVTTSKRVKVEEEQQLHHYTFPNGAMWPKASQFIRLPGDETLRDACVIPNFMQDHLSIDPHEVFDALVKLPVWSATDPIPSSGVGWLPGSHRTLNYRGKPIKRSKIWLQTDFEDGLLKYGYTGWQWKVSFASRPVKSIPVIANLLDTVNSRFGFDFNHIILTYYHNGAANIGHHSDKIKTFKSDSYFLVLKLGAARSFEFRSIKSEAAKAKVLFNEQLKAGTAVLVRCASPGAANERVTHAVPPQPGCLPSASIVFRCITSKIAWAKVRKEVEKRTSRESKAKKQNL